MKKILLSILLLTSSLFCVDFVVGETNFAIANPNATRNINGNIKIIGNTVLCPKVNGSCVESAPGVTNQELNLNFVNTDGFGGYAPSYRFKTSSRAKLEIPPNAKIVWAGLYAQGLLSFVHSANAAKPFLSEPIILTIPGLGKISKFADKTNLNDIWRAGTGIFYGSFSLVDELIGKRGSQINGWVTASNVMATEGLENGIGNSGAWVLAVIYEDADETLKNISIFNGYRVVTWGNNVPDTVIGISGFLTPTSGPVESSLSIFVGEGDKALAYDSLFLNDTPIGTPGNAFNSSIHGVDQRIPKIENNQGIDIQYHNVSRIIGNSNTSATIKMNSQGDIYYPIFAAFTTELYSPRVCYYIDTIKDADDGTVVYANKSFVQKLKPGGNYLYNIWLANMKLDNSTRPLETAEGVEIYMNYLDPSKLKYKNESTFIKNLNLPKIHITDALGDDLGEYSANSSTWRIGVNADNSNGGKLYPAVSFGAVGSKVFVDFNTSLSSSYNNKTIDLDDYFEFKTAFRTDVVTVGKDNAQKIPKCENFNTTAEIEQPEPGSFNVVNKNFNKRVGDTVDLNTTNEENALYTQIVSKEFKAKLISVDLDEDSSTSLKGKLTDSLDNTTILFDLIETPKFSTCTDAACKKDLCENAPSLLVANNALFFNSKGKGYIEVSTNVSVASKSVTFRMSYTDKSDENKTDCSLDHFSVRPKSFSIVDLASKPKGGKNETITIQAVNVFNNNSIGYNQTRLEVAVPQDNISLVIPTNCDKNYTTGEFSHNILNDFVDGIANATINYNNIGNLSIVILDTNWTTADWANNKKDCIENSSSNRFDSKGKLGCNVEKKEIIVFYPTNFIGNLNLRNFNDGIFTYLANSADMSAIISTDITSVLYDNVTAATNYHKNCWAKNVQYDVNLTKNPQDWKYITNGVEENATQRVIYSNIDSSIANITSSNNTNPAVVNTFQNQFINGTAANLEIGVNFKRAVNIAQNPFTLNATDFNITKIADNEINSTLGTNIASGDAKLYYGRVYSIDYVGPSPIDATLRYEGYCGSGCNPSNYIGLSSSNKNPNDSHWYLNTNHNDLEVGNITLLEQRSTPIKPINKIIINPINSTAILGGLEHTVLEHHNPPYADDIIMNTQEWLVYNKRHPGATYNIFNVEFIGPGGDWAGFGQVNSTELLGRKIESNATNRTRQKLDW